MIRITGSRDQLNRPGRTFTFRFTTVRRSVERSCRSLGTHPRTGRGDRRRFACRRGFRRRDRERTAGLEQRLEARDRLRPAAGDSLEDARVLTQLVVDDGQLYLAA